MLVELLNVSSATKSDVSGLGAGQLRGTRNIQPSTQVDACSDGIRPHKPPLLLPLLRKRQST